MYSAASYNNSSRDTNRSILISERPVQTPFTIFVDPDTSTAALGSKNPPNALATETTVPIVNSRKLRFRNRRELYFRRRLDLWINKLELRFFKCVCRWAWEYAPRKPIFGLVTDFSREAIRRLYEKRNHLTTADIDGFQEMLWAMKIWAQKHDIEVEDMTVEEAGGQAGQGVAILAKICLTHGSRPWNCLVVERRTAWVEIMQVCMGSWASTVVAPPIVMASRMMKDVLQRWVTEPNARLRSSHCRFLKRFFEAPEF